MNALSDDVFAVALTILVLDLKAPRDGSLSSLFALWPTGLSYAVSYLLYLRPEAPAAGLNDDSGGL